MNAKIVEMWDGYYAIRVGGWFTGYRYLDISELEMIKNPISMVFKWKNTVYAMQWAVTKDLELLRKIIALREGYHNHKLKEVVIAKVKVY